MIQTPDAITRKILQLAYSEIYHATGLKIGTFRLLVPHIVPLFVLLVAAIISSSDLATVAAIDEIVLTAGLFAFDSYYVADWHQMNQMHARGRVQALNAIAIKREQRTRMKRQLFAFWALALTLFLNQYVLVGYTIAIYAGFVLVPDKRRDAPSWAVAQAS